MKEPSRPARPEAARRLRLVFVIAGAGLAAIVGAGWFYRIPIADAVARSALADMGLEADFEITRLDLGGASLRRVRVGLENNPDLAAASADMRLGWGLSGPKLTSVRLVEPALRLSIGAGGLSLGSLDKLRRTASGGANELPAIAVEIIDGRALIATPYGAIPATFSSKGRLTRDFTAGAAIAPTTIVNGPRRLEGLRLNVRARTEGGALLVDAHGDLARLLDADRGADRGANEVTVSVAAVIPGKLTGAAVSLEASAARLATNGHAARTASLKAEVSPGPGGRFRSHGTLTAGAIEGPTASARAPRIALTASGDLSQATGEWNAGADALDLDSLHAINPAGAGDFSFDGRPREGAILAGNGTVTLPRAALDATGRRALLDSLPTLAGTPLGRLVSSGREATDSALTRFSTAAILQLDWRAGAGRLSFPGPVTAQAASGGVVTATPVESGRPVLMLLLPSGDIEGGARLTMEGGGLPPATLALTRFTRSDATFDAEGVVRIADWRAAGGRLDLANTQFTMKSADGKGVFSMDGAVAFDGATEAIRVRDLRAPLRLDASWGGGYRVVLRDGCTPVEAAAIGLPGHTLDGRRVSLCPGADGVLMGEDSAGRMFGGFTIDGAAFTGRMDDAARKPVSFAARRIEGRFTGPQSNSHLEIAVANPAYVVDFAPDRRIRFSGGLFEDPAVPSNVTEIAARWSSGPEGGRNVVRLRDGVATITDRKPATAETPDATQWTPRYNMLQLVDFDASLVGASIDATGGIDLIDMSEPAAKRKEPRRLAAVHARHDLKTGEGSADVVNPALLFGRNLDLYEITELARGVVDSMQGPVGVNLHAEWNNDGFGTGGHVTLADVNLNAASLGPVSGLSGDIALDDLALLTTPPGQTLTIRQLNPGVIVENGVITFQMLASDRVQMESASWPFAGGVLSVDPQIVQIGDDEFRMTLSLNDVDVARLLRQLDLKDLTATGTVEGSFPLVFSRDGAAIDGVGVLRAAPEGGTISYTGSAGGGLVGAPQIAFEALRSFAYDDLLLELSGQLDGELVSAIRFTGTNREPVGITTGGVAAPIPGFGRVTATGLPFRFTVSVRAPFRRLMQTSEGIQDARPLVDEAIRNGTVDPAPQPPN
ncbi:MAG: hypothetical protein FD124_2825 [Alphaproteobacteria bacterium]|nr:MAG: hypothetical protein FD124_2825 [Alphaproteobacteria bacterium]